MENQCKGMTRKGTQCKVKNGLKNGYCRLHLHQDEASLKKVKTKIKSNESVPSSKNQKQKADKKLRGTYEFPKKTEEITSNPIHETDENNSIKNEVFPDTKIIDPCPETDENKPSKSKIIIFSIIIITLLLFFSKFMEKTKK
ncbi:MAG: DUF5763 domain-containing protein [Chitinispirillia bacterium]|jgi:hypothetical protein